MSRARGKGTFRHTLEPYLLQSWALCNFRFKAGGRSHLSVRHEVEISGLNGPYQYEHDLSVLQMQGHIGYNAGKFDFLGHRSTRLCGPKSCNKSYRQLLKGLNSWNESDRDASFAVLFIASLERFTR